MSNYVEKNLRKDEHVILKAKVHWVVLLPHILLIFLIIGIFTIWSPLKRMLTTELAFTNKRLISKVGWINTHVLDTPLSKINNASVSSGLWGKIFKYGTIRISTSSDDYWLENIAGAESFRMALMEQLDELDSTTHLNDKPAE